MGYTLVMETSPGRIERVHFQKPDWRSKSKVDSRRFKDLHRNMESLHLSLKAFARFVAASDGHPDQELATGWLKRKGLH